MRRHTLRQRALTLLLCVAMLATYLPGIGLSAAAADNDGITTVADPQTLTRPAAIYGENTLNAGKVTVGKSVHNGDITVNGQNIALSGENNFLITISQTAQVMGLATETSVPVDVVFVLDTSSSMAGNKVTQMVTAANNAIATLMAANDNNRVAVVAFSAGQGGGTSNGAHASVLSGLEHYSGDAATNHIQWVNSRGTTSGNRNYIQGRGTNMGRRLGTSTGTNTQAGVALGGQLLANATNTTVTVDGKTVTRMPFLVIMSDGASSYGASGNWYDPNLNSSIGTLSENNGLGYLVSITAAYYKGLVTEHYYGENANADNRCYVYTMGLGLGSGSMAEMAMDPSGAVNNTNRSEFERYWASHSAGNAYNVTVGSGNSRYTVTAPSITLTNRYVMATGMGYTGGYRYNDDYFPASEASSLNEQFTKVVATIQQKAVSVPTKVSTGDHDFDGYVTFTDPLGEYMEVKDMKGVLAGGYFYKGVSFAQHLVNYGTATRNDDFDATFKKVIQTRLEMTDSTVSADALIAAAKASDNQAYYNSANDYDNSIVWWGNGYLADNGDQHVQVVAAADNDTIDYIRNNEAPEGANLICRSYFFYGEAGGANPNPEHKYLYFVVRVQRELKAPYRQTVTISAPASLLAMEKVLITETHNASGDSVYSATVTPQTPARVVYEVGLWDSINAENVHSIVSAEYKNEVVNGEGTANYDPLTDTYSFFTNDWNRTESVSSHHRAMAKATFDAAADNAFYTYQQDTLLVDKNGDPISSNPAGKDAYYVREYYDWSDATQNASPYTAVKKTKLIHVEIPANAKLLEKDGKWYIPKGVYTGETLEVNGDDTVKSPNATGSASVVNHPHRTGDVNNSHYTVFLGNNGLLQLKADPYIPVKTVSVNDVVDANGDPVKVGDILTYTVEVKNLLPYTADVTVTDQIPQGTAFVSGSAGSGLTATSQVKDAAMVPDSNNVLTWKLPAVPSGEVRFVSFQVQVTKAAMRPSVVPGGIVNVAQMQMENQYTVQSNPTINYPYGKDVTDVNGSELDNSHGYKVGDTLVYHIRLTNPDSEPAKVVVTDPIPAGTTFLSADNGGVYDPDTGVITWTFENMAGGTSRVVSFQVQINASAKADSEQNAPASGEIYLPNTATIVVENDTQITFTTNTTENWVDVGDMTISKLVADGGDRNKTFTIHLTESTGMLSGKYSAAGGNESFVEFVNGKASLTIRHGQTVTLQGIPAGSVITVEEDVSQLPGWTASYNTQSVTITKGAANAVSSVSVTNTYTLQPMTMTLKGKKTLVGTLPQSATFGFVAIPDSANPVVGEPLTGEVTVKAEGTYDFTFSPKTVSVPGVYKYTIYEVDGSIQGVDYDERQYVLIATFTDNGDGTMRCVATLDGNAFDPSQAVSFENIYTPADVPLTLVAKKTLKSYNTATGQYENAKLSAGDYRFRVTLKGSDNVLTIGTNAADGTITFNPFYFSASMLDGVTANGAGDKIKTFDLVISEIVPEQTMSPNMLYDLEGREIQAVLKLNANGVLSVSVNGDSDGNVDLSDTVAFVNYRNPGSVTVQPVGTKTTEDAPAGVSFSFSVTNTESGNEAAAGVGAANGQISFSALSFSREGTYTYWIKEANAGNTTNGITYDASRYLMKVVVSRNSYNRLVAEVTYWSSTNVGSTNIADYTTQASAPSFHNKYEAGGYINLTATKRLSGRDLLAGEFAFKLVRSDNGGEIDGLVDKDGKITFSTMYYSSQDIPAGQTSAVIRYVMSEVIPTTAALPGVTYDKSQHDVYVRITDNGDGTITTELVKPENGGYVPVGSTDTGVTFRNSYAAVHGDEIAFRARKELTGRDLREGEFEFMLYHGDRLVDVATNDAQGNVLFRQRIDAAAVPGTYTLTVREAKGILGSVDYDNASYNIYVKIEDDQKGNIVATLVDASGEALELDRDGVADLTSTIVFRNSYKPTKALIQLEAEKELTGRDLADKEFNFVVRKDSASGQIVAVGSNDASGNILFSTFDITQADMVNATVQPNGKKVKTFTYVVMESNNQRPGVEVDDTRFTVTVTVTDDGNGALSAQIHYPVVPVVFRNTYTPAPVEVPLVAFKHLTGKTLQDKEFTFQLSADGKVQQTKQNDASGVVSFDNLKFEKAGVYTYTVSEEKGSKNGMTYDETKYTVKVTVTDDRNGKLVATAQYFNGDEAVSLIRFENSYTPPAIQVVLEGKKTITDPDGNPVSHAPSGFRFSVKDMTGTEVATAVSDENGNIRIEGLSFSAAGEYRFLIGELPTDKPGYTIDPTIWCVHITISFDQVTGQLSQSSRFIHVAPENHEAAVPHASEELAFVNIYDPADVALQLMIRKELEGRPLRDHEFSFYMEDKATGLHAAQSFNKANGEVLFELHYSKPGTYAYEIREYIPDENDKMGGVTYSGESYDLTVTVTDDGSGKLVATARGASVTGTGLLNLSESVIFHNKYKAEPVQVTVDVVKHLEGRELVDDMFRFRLENAEDPLEVYTAYNDASGLVSFKGIQVDEVGIYTYNVSEIQDGTSGVTYDQRVYTVQFKVTDDGFGQLVATKPVFTLNREKVDYALFENLYTPESIAVELNVDKIVESTTSATISPEGFQFLLADPEGNEVAKVTSDASGAAKFSLEFDGEDVGNTYNLTISEINTGRSGVIYSKETYQVEITVSQNTDGTLFAELKLDGEATETVSVSFVNTYKPSSNPLTGDDFHLFAFIGMMVLSSFGLAAVIVSKKNNKEEQKA